MKKLYKSLLAAAAVIPAAGLTGCIEETFPTTVATQNQVNASPSAISAFANAMPAYMNSCLMLPTEQHYDWGYGSIMHIRDIMTGDMPITFSNSGYDWYTSWEQNTNQGEEWMRTQFIWTYYAKQVQTSNLTIGAIDPDTDVDENRYYLGAAYAFRAMAYLDMARMYEYLPTDGTEAKSPEGNSVLHLTVPIVTESMGEAEARNNPRATREQMIEFIISDLDKAETYITATARPSKVMPDLACVYGLKARAYMWTENYPEAKNYARKAIDASGCVPTTRDQWLSTTNGFNTLSTPSWMWGMQLVQEDNQVKTTLLNWASWASNEYVNGYSGAEPYVMIDANLYNSINDDDFRKLTFVAPKSSKLSGQENYINRAATSYLPTYASLKFKPGEGNMENYLTACVVAVPTMRVEEMYLIEAEAAAQSAPSEGKSLIENFMKTYRYATYTFNGSSKDQVVNEIFKQKQIELYGEGLIFYDYKRLNKPVTRRYSGSNFYPQCQFNTTTRPAWMNFVIVRSESSNNTALIGYNNPDPSQCYEDQITTK